MRSVARMKTIKPGNLRSIPFIVLTTTLVLISGLSGWPAAAAPDQTTGDLLVTLRDLAAQIQRSTPEPAHSATAPAAARSTKAPPLAQLRRDLDLLEQRIASSGLADQQLLASKVDSLRELVGNLEAVAAGEPEPRLGVGSTRAARAVGGNAQHPANDLCSNALLVAPGTYYGSTATATNDGEASCGASLSSPDVWFRIIADADETLVIETFGSDFDTVLSVHKSCPGFIDNQMRCNDDSYGLASAVVIDTYSGEDYLIRVSGFSGATGTYQLSIGSGASLSGQLTSAATGDPLDHVMVEVHDQQGQYLGTTRSEPDGTWSVGWLTSGTYFASSQAGWGDYLDEVYDNIRCTGGVPSGCDATDGTPITAIAGSPATGIDFSLDDSSSVFGTVLDEGSLLPVGSTIRLWNADGEFLRNGFSNSTGEYRIRGLEAGSYYLGVVSSSHVDELFDNVPCPGLPPEGCDLADGTLVTVPDAGEVQVDFRLTTSNLVWGRVTSAASGEPIAGATVERWKLPGIQSRSVSTDAEGYWRFGGMVAGPYYFLCRTNDSVPQVFNQVDCEECDVIADGTAVAVPEVGQVSGIDFSLYERGRLSGRVTDQLTGDPLAWATISIYDDAGDLVEWHYSDSAGEYTSGGLPAGTYFAKAAADDYPTELYDDVPCPDPCDPTTGTPLVVAAEQVTAGVDLALMPMGSVCGSVYDALTGDPIYGKRIEASPTTPGLSGNAAYSWIDGSYCIGGLATGTYLVFADEGWDGSHHVDELWDDVPCPGGIGNGCDAADGTPVSVTEGVSTPNIDFALDQRGSISGSLLDEATGEPVRGWVVVRRPDGEEVASSASLTDGSYIVDRLNPGSYLVQVNSGACFSELWNDVVCDPDSGCDLAAGTPVAVQVNTDTTGIDFLLTAKGTVSGTVTAADGQPLSGIKVRLFSADGTPIWSVQTGVDGGYRLGGLLAGDYRLLVEDEGDIYLDQLYQGITCLGGAGVGCDVTQGTPIPVTLGATTTIDVILQRTGRITGWIGDALTGAGVYDARVELWNEVGERVSITRTGRDGSYQLDTLVPGKYFLLASAPPYLGELYDDIPCPPHPIGCTPTKGTPVTVEPDGVVRFIDFKLQLSVSAISGTIVAEDTGLPIGSVLVDIWDAGTGVLRVTAKTDAGGLYVAKPPAGTYNVSTHNNVGYLDAVYDGIRCPKGSVQSGDCGLDGAAEVVVVEDMVTTDIDFSLAAGLFVDGFESGSTSMWTGTVQ